MKTFTCRVCGNAHQTTQTHVAGQPIGEWFAERGERCSPCLLAAQQSVTPSDQVPTVVSANDVLIKIRGQRGMTIQERFEKFHELNPWVLQALETLIQDMVARRRRHLSIEMFWQVLRHQYNRSTADPSSSFKLNDHYRSRYIRHVLERHPEWVEYFELRQLRAA